MVKERRLPHWNQRTLAGELFPAWRERFALVTGRATQGWPWRAQGELARGRERLR